MKIQKAENCTIGYEIIDRERRFYIGDLQEIYELKKEIEIFLELESQKILKEDL